MHCFNIDITLLVIILLWCCFLALDWLHLQFIRHKKPVLLYGWTFFSAIFSEQVVDWFSCLSRLFINRIFFHAAGALIWFNKRFKFLSRPWRVIDEWWLSWDLSHSDLAHYNFYTTLTLLWSLVILLLLFDRLENVTFVMLLQ